MPLHFDWALLLDKFSLKCPVHTFHVFFGFPSSFARCAQTGANFLKCSQLRYKILHSKRTRASIFHTKNINLISYISKCCYRSGTMAIFHNVCLFHKMLSFPDRLLCDCTIENHRSLTVRTIERDSSMRFLNSGFFHESIVPRP